ncbi:conserved exported protein of unknown function [Paraburkholderia kururiensis]|jgi:hypothetical protein|uniref:hypothetical protein n=1 Tax=Paraburkholderia TaxID=1822464 RepID=UPI000AE24DCD|nr:MULTISPECIES: hypothetical protein [Paraburkholderia]WEY39466.1 hypothetical protein P2869_03565 [Paraburkholderia sp. SUR17]
MKKTKLLALTVALAAISPFAHADLSEDAHALKEDVKTAGKDTGHAIAHGAKEAGHDIASGAKVVGHGVASGAKVVGHGVASGAKAVGHGIADTSRKGYEATKRAVKGDDKPAQ